MDVEPGLPRLLALCEAWLGNAKARNGSFFAAASMEFDAKAGPVQDRIVHVMRVWLKALESVIRVALDLGQLDPATDPVQLAFELNALQVAANWTRLVFDEDATVRARTAMWQRIASVTRRPPPDRGS